MNTTVLYELVQVALGNRSHLSRIPTEKEWETVFEDAEMQAVVGVCLASNERLMSSNPGQMVNLPLEMKLEWIRLAEQIRQRNKLLDKQTAKIWRHLKDNRLETAILKGQGIAALYGDEIGELRQSGDIDIWVMGGYRTVCNYVQRSRPTDDLSYHRFHYDYFENTEVELHHRPTLMRNLLDDRKLARWYNLFGADSFVYLEDKGFAVPPVEFNRIFILTHIYRHFLFEGIGLRQVIDYYFVLRDNGGRDKKDIAKILKKLRLTRFAEAVMWILHEKLGLEEQYLICGMNEKEGRFVLNEIEQTGNFGHNDRRYRYKYFFKLRRQMEHGAHLLLHYPSEVIWTPIWLIYHRVWKWAKKRKIREKWSQG